MGGLLGSIHTSGFKDDKAKDKTQKIDVPDSFLNQLQSVYVAYFEIQSTLSLDSLKDAQKASKNCKGALMDFDAEDVGSVIVVQTAEDSGGTVYTTEDEISTLLFGNTTSGVELVITAITDDNTVISICRYLLIILNIPFTWMRKRKHLKINLIYGIPQCIALFN